MKTEKIHSSLPVEQHQLANQELLKVLMSSSDTAIYITDSEGLIKTWNKGAEHIYKFSGIEVLNNPISVLGVPEITPSFLQAYTMSETTASSQTCEEIHYKKGNKPFWTECSTIPICDKDSNIILHIKIVKDISVKKKLQEENDLLNKTLEDRVLQRTRELAVVNKELEAFSYSVSHDLRTPLRAISGYTEILKEDHYDCLDAEGQRVLNKVLENTNMMGRLIDDLLCFSKMSRLEAVAESLDMEKMARMSMNELLEQWKGRYSIKFEPLHPCTGDASMLKQVWVNILDNALKYSSKKSTPEITIGSMAADDHHVYYVKDNGDGFDMKYKEKLFGVFQRLHRQDEFNGTGLGLALSKRIISKHGGEIWAESEKGSGSQFYFIIPKNKS